MNRTLVDRTSVILCGVVLVLMIGLPHAMAQNPTTFGGSESGSLRVDSEKLARWNQLSDEQKDILRKRHKMFKNMDPQRCERIRRNWKRFKNLPPEERQRLKEKWRKWRDLSPQERQKLKERREKLRNASPEDKARFNKNRERWQKLPAERKMQLRRQWKQKHQR